VAYATLYYKNQSDAESPKSKEEKIQTPPTVDENSTEEPKTETVAPVTTPTSPPAATGYTEYTVVSGDTLSGIANTHDMTSTALAKYNNISVDTMLQIGQKLKIPNN
jgi:LysM repeat protein